MRANRGKVTLWKVEKNRLKLETEDDCGFLTAARLTPAQAMRLAAQLQRWAMKAGGK